MFSRRLLRIKVLQILYAHYQVEGKTYLQSEKDLLYSIDKSYELYHYLILLIIEVAGYAESMIELGMNKKVPTSEDLNPNKKFISNRLLKHLSDHHELNDFVSRKKISWRDNPELIRNLFKLIAGSDIYNLYMNSGGGSWEEDKKLILAVYSDLVINFEELYNVLEEKSIFWLDDVDFIIRMVIKTLKSFRNDGMNRLMPICRDEEDLEYAKKLLRKTIIRKEDNDRLISESAKNWELERIAFTDNLIIQMAITESVEFQNIPVKVTINEYIEISKAFSTRKSSKFINGILDHIIAQLKAEGKISKTGRGLMDH